jgi:hypothetical protein
MAIGAKHRKSTSTTIATGEVIYADNQAQAFAGVDAWLEAAPRLERFEVAPQDWRDALGDLVQGMHAGSSRILTNSLASHDVPAVNAHYKARRDDLLAARHFWQRVEDVLFHAAAEGHLLAADGFRPCRRSAR